MKAAVLNQQPGALEIEELRVDAPGPGEVLIHTVGAGLCHSDLHFMEGLFPLKVPAVMGHESAGVVEAVGEGVTYVQPGDHVVCCLSIFCGRCPQCLSLLSPQRQSLRRPSQMRCRSCPTVRPTRAA